jgi:hypothetical protein
MPDDPSAKIRLESLTILKRRHRLHLELLAVPSRYCYIDR